MAKPSTSEVDGACAEDLGFLENGRAVLHAGVDTQQDQFPATAGAFRVTSSACSTLISLFICLITWARWEGIDVDHDGHAGEFRVERAGDGQASML